jgi:putative toxin-antitoxin system antitoxin component (TIGR02293 family)
MAEDLTSRVAENIGAYWTAEGRQGEAGDPFADVDAIREGLPYQVAEALREALQISESRFAEVAAIPTRTLNRRKKEGRFPVAESDQVSRVGRVFQRAVHAMGGEAGAREWLDAPQPALRGRKPLDLLDVEPGARLVEDHLGRIVQGVYW